MADISYASSLLDALSGLDDSKKISSEIREKLYHQIEKMQDESRCQYSFAYRDAVVIDAVGIREANRQCMQDTLLSLIQFTSDEDNIEIFIDGCDNYLFDLGKTDMSYYFQKVRKGKSREVFFGTNERIKVYYMI